MGNIDSTNRVNRLLLNNNINKKYDLISISESISESDIYNKKYKNKVDSVTTSVIPTNITSVRDFRDVKSRIRDSVGASVEEKDTVDLPNKKVYYIDGTVDTIVLKNPLTNKIVILLGDVHSGVDYCDSDVDSVTTVDLLDSFLEHKKEDLEFTVLLEEVDRRGVKLSELWPDAIHTQELKEWYLDKAKKIVAIDIRPYLVPFSHQKLVFNKEKKIDDVLDKKETVMKIDKYLKQLDSFFELEGDLSDESVYFFKIVLKLLKNKKVKSGLCEMYNTLKDKYSKMKRDYEIDYELRFLDTYKRSKEFFDKLEDLKLNIMDWYTVLHLLQDKNSVVHLGLAHYNNVATILVNKFGFEVIKNSKLCDFTADDINCKLPRYNKRLRSCAKIDKKYFKK
jgi:hypothetical protein